MNIGWLLFSFNGRIGRLAFFATLFCVAIASLAFSFGVAAYTGAPLHPKTRVEIDAFVAARLQPQILVPYLVWLVALYWVHFAVSAKRLHDIGRSGWLNLKIVLAFVGAGVVAGVGVAMHSNAVTMGGTGLIAIVSLYSAWIGLLQLFKRGDEDANDYGDAPGAGGKAQMERVVRVFEASPTPAPRMSAVAAGGDFGKRRG